MAEIRRPRVPESDRGEPGTAARVRGERVLLAPPAAARTGRGSRRRQVWPLVLGLTAVLASVLAVTAAASSATPSQSGAQQATLAQPAPQQPPPLPLPNIPTGSTCAPNSPDPTCHFPTGSPRPSVPATPLPPITELPAPTSCFPGQVGCTPSGPPSTPNTSPTTPPCSGEDCIPQPSSSPPNTAPGQNGPGVGGDDPDCGITNISGCINKAINSVFRDLVKAAFDPILKLLGDTAFTTPTLDSLPGVANLWNNSWLIVMACYSGLIMIGGIIVMSHESVQSRYSMKDIAPRLIVSFFASTLSLFLIDKAIRLANALSAAVLTDGVDPPKLGDTLTGSINGAYSTVASGGLFVILLQGVLLIAVIALLLVYVVRVIITLILIVSAPLWVACHALPHTDGIARWGWRALGATLGIQVAQSLTLIIAVNTFLNGSVHLFNSAGGGIMMLFVVLGLLYILFKIPFWFLSATKLGTGRSFLGGLVKAVIVAKTFGAVAGRSGAFGRPRAAAGAKVAHGTGSGGRTGVADLPWPPQQRLAPTAEAVNKRMQRDFDAERLRAVRQSRLPSQEPRFLQPSPQEPTHDPAVSAAVSGPPAMPEFSSAPQPVAPIPPQSARRRGGHQIGAAPRFQAPGTSRRTSGGQSSARPVAVAAVPPHLRFQPPAPEPPHVSRPVRPATPSVVAPAFRPARPEPRFGDARPRTRSVPPISFRAAPPAPPKSQPKSPPRGGEKS
ncbi:hypothetical protein [Amycolatopsis sp. H20-H5]|uniref:hypothetical protein n=1 Tax=Amycolatopsis sp. H20-H5 TaxID=3046309 RepID=UPI002DB5FEBF|nr:hypothetical protein [Amycolatopsis sp. H20-H5]MEC3974348.1 hypothetical protein [Amycolatopsis sp. H20-H5]